MTAGISVLPVDRPPQRERVELILAQLDHLPTLPVVAARLLALTTSDDSSARDVVELLETDAALTAIILRLVRRADLGVRGDAITVARAVTLLGFNAVRNAVLSVQLYQVFSRADENNRAAVTRRGIWQHSVAVACTAEAIAERVGGKSLAGEAFVCGLLHDIGKVALDACLPKSYARVVAQVEHHHACICDVERQVLGLDHTVAGKRLVERWRLPPAVIESVWLHHQSPEALPSSVAYGQLVRIIHLADDLVRRDGIGYSGYGYVGDVEELSSELGLDADGLAQIAERRSRRTKPLCDVLGLDDDSGRTQYTASLVTANRHLARLNAKLTEANRRLEVRSRCLGTLEEFTRRINERDSVGDICVAAADGIRAMLDAKLALAFFTEVPGRCVHVGVSGLPDDGQAASVIDVGDPQGGVGTDAASCVPPPRGLLPAPAACDGLWQRCTGTHSCDQLWMLPLVAGDSAAGAVLVAAPEESARRFQSAPAECEALSTAMGLALTSARARLESEYMNEELLDLNRRLRTAQQELIRTRSISMTAAMAAGTAHELNGPLAVVSGRAQMELGRCDDEESVSAFKIIVEHTQRAARIVTDLMRFAKPEPPTPVPLALAGVLEPLCQHWRAKASLRDEQLTLRLADQELMVYADGVQLHEILDAVIANAVDATDPETARLQINLPSCVSDETVRIVVEDNGVGMTRDVLEHAIDPFFSDRPAGRGRGLGLSRAYRLVEIHGGRLWLESTPKVGTKVTIELPARPPSD